MVKLTETTSLSNGDYRKEHCGPGSSLAFLYTLWQYAHFKTLSQHFDGLRKYRFPISFAPFLRGTHYNPNHVIVITPRSRTALPH
jgi:hypothetical protein